MDVNITKVLDGIFLGDQFIATDFEFIFGNKVSHLIGWTLYPLDLAMNEEGVYHHNVYKSTEENQYPNIDEILAVNKFIDMAKEQCMCCLLYGDKQWDAALILIPYLTQKYLWDFQSGLDFLRRKVYIPQIPQQLWNKMQIVEKGISQLSEKPLKAMVWDYDFLSTYTTQDPNETLLIVTLKNALRQPDFSIIEKQKTNKRVQWLDRMQLTSTKSINIQPHHRLSNSLKKNQKYFFTKPIPKKPKQQAMLASQKKINISKSCLKGNNLFNRSIKEKDQLIPTVEDFITLKELPFNSIQNVLKTKSRKRGQLKQNKSDKNMTNVRPASSKKSLVNYNSLNAKQFLSSLKNLSHLQLGYQA